MQSSQKLAQRVQGIVQVDKKRILISGEFLKNDKKLLQFYGYQNMIVISKDGKLAHKILPLSFENRYTVLRHPTEDRQSVGKPRGFKLEADGQAQTLTITSDDSKLLLAWRQYLAQRINQRGFHESFKAHKKIGKGNFASVYLADRLEDQKAFAIKAFSKEVAYSQERGKDAIKNEIELMRQLDSPSLIKLHEVYETENSLYMVLDLLEGGSLYDKIKHRPTFNSREIEIIIKTLMEGLAHLHSKRIMHRDLKPENILFRKANSVETVCIADFGLATNADEEQYLYVRCGTPGFVAPEVVNCKDQNVHYEPVCDVFSLGLIFYILLTGKPAFPGKSYNDVLVKNRRCDIVFDGLLFDNVPSTSKDLLEKMLQKDPTKRITAQQALKHHYFAKFNQQMMMEDGTVDEEDDEGGLGNKINKLREEQVKFDMARINQLQNSPINSPIITATSRFTKNTNVVDPTFVMNQPLFSGKVDSVQGSPESTSFNSPGAVRQQISIQQRPSKFKDPSAVDNDDQQQQSKVKVSNSNNTNPLHKYALMNKSGEESKQVNNVKNSLKKFE